MSDDERLGQVYRAAIADVPDSGHLDPGTARATARRRQHRKHGALAGVAVVAVLAGLLIVIPRLGDGRNLVAVPPRSTPTAAADPAMTVEPATAAPGSVVTLWFPGELDRGVAFKLESQQAAGWQVEYYLIAGRDGKDPGPRSWYRPGDPRSGWPDVGVGGPGGERVLIPEGADPGRYRLCTANAKLSACTQLKIT